jgi:hypothetical protein
MIVNEILAHLTVIVMDMKPLKQLKEITKIVSFSYGHMVRHF